MKGVIFIPDISGFTNFVQNTDATTGAMIMQELLSTMIHTNPLRMNVSEIEGDAILFYRLGAPYPVSELVKAFVDMQLAFKNRYDGFKKSFNLKTSLSLKLIVHYGDIVLYDVAGFEKLYGEAIIEAHRLLKNGNKANDYVLVTEDYVQALKVNLSDLLMGDHQPERASNFLRHISNIAYHIFPNAKKHLVFQTYNLAY